MRVLGFLLLLVCLPAIAGNEVYKWVDADGSVHYGNEPPKGAKVKPVSGGVTVMPAFKAPEKPIAAPAPPAAPAAAPARPEPAATERPQGETGAQSSPAERAAELQAARRQKLLDTCRKNRGTNCEEEVDAKIDGLDGTSFVPVPGWSQPPIRPSRPVQPVAKPASSAPSHKESRVREAPRKADASQSSESPARR
ncbi:DUF4124 domain-containing protein [Uliginosibacterium paludis]|uniref:DUF4124 domain-containing protein n=1 Tax=Uliginosibacterium paludis TaxID=1615952 RepID=A0ABV2CKS1_9RHOO